MLANAVSRKSRSETSRLSQIGCAALVSIGVVVSVPRTLASVGIPQGVWLIDNEVAVQIFDCSNLLCGRIVWLSIPRDPQGRLVLDKKNPDPALRQRPLCGLTIFWGCDLMVQIDGQMVGSITQTMGKLTIFQGNSNPPTRSRRASIRATRSRGRPRCCIACHTAHRMDGAEVRRRTVCKFTKVRTTRVLSRGTSDARYFRDQWT